MAQCLLHHGWLVLLKTGACCGLPIFFEVTTNWRAGCQKLACPVRREGRPESSSLPLSVATASANQIGGQKRDRSDKTSDRLQTECSRPDSSLGRWRSLLIRRERRRVTLS